MGKDSSIEWTDHTFNAWHGCEKVSPACANCYAEAQSIRYGFKIWGKAAPRRFFGPKHWNAPHLWDIEAKREGVRRRVFCNSMSDTFEDRKDLEPWRSLLWELIQSTSGLDWLLLTKRPENISRMVPPAWLKAPPANVWYGTTVEDQEHAEERIPALLDVPARVRFLSCEPLLGAVGLRKWIDCGYESGGPAGWVQTASPIHWVIVGGESGPGSRETRVERIWTLVQDCRRFEVAVFVKQLGARVIDRNDAGFDGVEPRNWPDGTETDDWDLDPARQYQGADARILLADRKGGDPKEWPEALRVQEFPTIERNQA